MENAYKKILKEIQTAVLRNLNLTEEGFYNEMWKALVKDWIHDMYDKRQRKSQHLSQNSLGMVIHTKEKPQLKIKGAPETKIKGRQGKEQEARNSVGRDNRVHNGSLMSVRSAAPRFPATALWMPLGMHWEPVLTDRNCLQAEETAMASGSTAMEAMEEAGAQYDLHIIFRNAYHGMER